MTTEELLIRACCDHPHELDPRLRLADYLLEQGEEERAEFVQRVAEGVWSRSTDPDTVAWYFNTDLGATRLHLGHALLVNHDMNSHPKGTWWWYANLKGFRVNPPSYTLETSQHLIIHALLTFGGRQSALSLTPTV